MGTLEGTRLRDDSGVSDKKNDGGEVFCSLRLVYRVTFCVTEKQLRRVVARPSVCLVVIVERVWRIQRRAAVDEGADGCWLRNKRCKWSK